MFEVKRMKYWIYLTVFVFLVGLIYLGYFCPAKICAFTNIPATTATDPRANQTQSYWEVGLYCNTSRNDSVRDYMRGKLLYPNHTAQELDREYVFNMDEDRDVFVFLHIQKVGGSTFGRHLVKNMKLSKPCVCYRGKKRCDCLNVKNHMWLFSRHSSGWRCGLHADWTELTSCVDEKLDQIENTKRNRRFLYITILREPYNRYLSEYMHVKRGGTWLDARLQCNGHQATLEEVPFCFDDNDWSGVTLDEFTTCPHNLANNRQTRMLANLSLSGCYGSPLTRTERDCIMLNSAKDNLAKMAFFGLTEYQVERSISSKTFGLKFYENFFQYSHTNAKNVVVSMAQKNRILELNGLDIQLYDFAKKLFFVRLNAAQKEDATNQYLLPGNVKRQLSPIRDDSDYEMADDNYADDDSFVNHRLVKKLRSTDTRVGKQTVHRNRRWTTSK